jgi:hypothetical protein
MSTPSLVSIVLSCRVLVRKKAEESILSPFPSSLFSACDSYISSCPFVMPLLRVPMYVCPTMSCPLPCAWLLSVILNHFIFNSDVVRGRCSLWQRVLQDLKEPESKIVSIHIQLEPDRAQDVRQIVVWNRIWWLHGYHGKYRYSAQSNVIWWYKKKIHRVFIIKRIRCLRFTGEEFNPQFFKPFQSKVVTIWLTYS